MDIKLFTAIYGAVLMFDVKKNLYFVYTHARFLYFSQFSGLRFAVVLENSTLSGVGRRDEGVRRAKRIYRILERVSLHMKKIH